MENGKYEWSYSGHCYGYCYYKDDKLNGKFREWYDNGQLREYCYYKNGKLDGEHKKWYDDNRQLLKHYYYIDNRLICEQFQQHKKRLLFIRKKLIERFWSRRMKCLENYLINDLIKLCEKYLY